MAKPVYCLSKPAMTHAPSNYDTSPLPYYHDLVTSRGSELWIPCGESPHTLARLKTLLPNLVLSEPVVPHILLALLQFAEAVNPADTSLPDVYKMATKLEQKHTHKEKIF